MVHLKDKDFAYQINEDNPVERKRLIKSLFDEIVPRYDLLNRLLSLGQDIWWRHKTAALVPVERAILLDICAGTGDMTRVLAKKGHDVFSLDFSREMLKKGIDNRWIKKPLQADASRLPFKTNSFSAATVTFGIRNIPDIAHFLGEVRRVLKPEGRFIILELTRPRNRLVHVIFSFYVGFLLPWVGGLISGNKAAYSYLSGTVRSFPDAKIIAGYLKENGFTSINTQPLSFGAVTLFSGNVAAINE